MPGRQLAVYDFAAQPAGLGDFYIFLQASLSLSAREGIDDVDLCIVCDPSRGRIPEFADLMSEVGSLRAKIFDMLPLAQLHPTLRDIFVVDRLESAFDLARRAVRPYTSCWPSFEMLASGNYLYYPSLIILDKLHHRCPVFPRLRSRPAAAAWADQFLADRSRGGVSVTVNLRSNPKYGTDRNMNPAVWRAFFDDAATRHAATFFLLGSPTEDFSAFRPCSNTVITKDWNTNMEQDFALIERANVHMGSSSGPSIFPVFLGNKPTLIVNGGNAIPQLATYQGALTWDGTYLRFTFGSTNYRSTAVPETSEFLGREFTAMLGALAAAA
jgi:hypothetical protein